MSDAETELQAVGILLAERSGDLTAYLVGEFGDRIPELPKDPALVDLLNGSAGSNLENLAHLLRGHIPIDQVRAPAAAIEYARRLAQRSTPPSALLRAYRLGQQLILRWANDEISRRVPDQALALQASHLLTETSFQYVDAVSEDVMGAYQTERERWLANRSAVQREIVDTLLRGERLELATAEATLGYRLHQHHLGLVLWTDGSDDGLRESEHLLARLAQRVGSGGHPLFVPRDRDTAWAWLPVGPSGVVDLAAVGEVMRTATKGTRVALGGAEAGEPGFRATHLAAAAAHRVAQLGHSVEPVVSYVDPTVRAAALLAGDLGSTRFMVARTLGGLAADTDGAARLRDTLLAFVEDRESYVATAARMHLHKNTVKYRVDRAVEVRGKPVSEDRLDLELALIACKWLGPEVLVKEGPSGA
ncbi:helix-turn-helix domain-containing protein [Nocardioides humilatus]|uniref:helix-turn-helix domain-containing protein n=1 Tax=Nocardioides humilatus TaxID=2607660 RepID=UPI00165EE248|nr:helix-turn-helix domain-containing protein [Nocardioides humilatus]